MYVPPHFNVDDENEIARFIQANAFGQLISFNQGSLCSTHLPFFLSKPVSNAMVANEVVSEGDGEMCLLAHLARENPQLDDIDGQDVLVTLQGAHDYISPSWYEGRGVPTWNYQTVHISGRCDVFNDPERLQLLVKNLTDKYEASFEEPWQANYPPAMLKAIVGVEISIDSVQCKYKLSQNRPSHDQENVVRKLRELGSDALADEMELNLTKATRVNAD